ncbi:glycoside hydrolase family 76 protein [Mucilaginibacter sp. UR6-11]|uniref:glycoside hydrolase family 76 protein n=1 Tax=Mucilaginibacter sp. UR6-11 TaxID=1435644 RepID=UPI001E450865|nr:glycoside hydrolase family 76 protein [Mucilaginibacter sp. UR6-11]MCC8424005.1 glycoside hydrolase family 76 protein [Mucilaginibacter sp. UR6-11]
MRRKINTIYFSLDEGGLNQSLNRGKQLAVIAALGISFIFAGCKKEQSASRGNTALTTSATNIGLPVTPPPLPTKSEALLAMQVYNNHFYNQYGTYGPSFKAYYWKDDTHAGRMDFWTQQEAIETLIDAYNINPSTDLKNKIAYLYNGVRDGYGLLWTSNTFNDDVVWGSLMCVRAYQITNDGGMLDMAKNNFNMMWNRAWDTTALGGGLWWNTSNNTKNTCVNAPAVICAMLLYQATGDVTYKNKAKLVMDWMVSKLYTASTGEVKGAIIPNGTITEGALSYTQGTFIGACDILRADYPTGNYLAMGTNAMNYAKNSMCNTAGGILNDENGSADTQGMKGIFARWACKFVQHTATVSTYGAWLDANAAQAWSIRNSMGLMWTVWGTRTPETTRNAFETTSGVSMVNNIYDYR